MEFLIPRFLIDSADIIAGAVTTPKLADDAVTEDKQATRRALVVLSAAQSIPNNTLTKLAFAAEEYDNGSIHDIAVNNSRLTIPSGYTLARVFCGAEFVAAAGGYRELRVVKNNAAVPGGGGNRNDSVSAAGNIALAIATPWLEVAAGDYFECVVGQTSGAALNVDAVAGTYFGIEVKA